MLSKKRFRRICRKKHAGVILKYTNDNNDDDDDDDDNCRGQTECIVWNDDKTEIIAMNFDQRTD